MKELFDRGSYAEALDRLQATEPRTRQEKDELNCLLTECLLLTGKWNDVFAKAEGALADGVSTEHSARYWAALARIWFARKDRGRALEAVAKAKRAAEKCGNPSTLAWIQQLFLVTHGVSLGSGLMPAVREAYRTAVKSADPAVLAAFHARLCQLEGERGAFGRARHHLALAEALLDRCEHSWVRALLYVNQAAVLGTTGDFEAGRHSAQRGFHFAQKSGAPRLILSAAANASYCALSLGDLSVAETWLKAANRASEALDVVEVGLLETAGCLALMRGNGTEAARILAKAQAVIESTGLEWTTIGERYSLVTLNYLHKKRAESGASRKVISTLRNLANASCDKHGELLAGLLDTEWAFDNSDFASAEASLAWCIKAGTPHPAQLSELNRLAARSLWLDGHGVTARRRLVRATAGLLIHGTRLSWAEALCEVRALPSDPSLNDVYGIPQQVGQLESKFIALATPPAASWYSRTPAGPEKAVDALDGFDEAIAILESADHPEWRGREALATVVSLRIAERAALVLRASSGLRILASHNWKPASVSEAVNAAEPLRLDIGRVDGQAIELVAIPKTDIRSSFALAGLARLLEAARAADLARKDSYRIESLWQPEVIVEEPGAVFSSPGMIDLMETARKVALTTLPVLLLGNTGTGKEVLARAIHRASARANKVFLPFNCSSVPRDMVESQLFGFKKGAFTGALEDSPGIIRACEGGTLFLDEIGELSPEIQPKLLRFLEASEVHPLGEPMPIKVDVRVIAATNANLEDLIELKQFREDLYYRLNIVRFVMPNLADRREEIPQLVTHLVRRFETQEKRKDIRISDELMEYLLLYRWPGNIRQLYNELRRMVAMAANGDVLRPSHLSTTIRATRKTVSVDDPVAADETLTADPKPQKAPEPPPPPPPDPNSLTLQLDRPLPEAVQDLERAMIEHAIARANGRMEDAARLLGISRKGLFLKRRRWASGEEPAPPKDAD